MDKNTIRKYMKNRRSQMLEEEHKQKDRLIIQTLIHSAEYQQCEVVLSYSALGSEVDLKELLSIAQADGKEVYYPKVSGSDMDFFQINRLSQLAEGCFHVCEPTGEEPVLDVATCKKKLLILCPGLAFNYNGHRIGYGKGYYDRYLYKCKQVNACYTAIGIAYDFQLEYDFCNEKDDEPLNYIISEKRKVRIQ